MDTYDAAWWTFDRLMAVDAPSNKISIVVFIADVGTSLYSPSPTPTTMAPLSQLEICSIIKNEIHICYRKMLFVKQIIQEFIQQSFFVFLPMSLLHIIYYVIMMKKNKHKKQCYINPATRANQARVSFCPFTFAKLSSYCCFLTTIGCIPSFLF